MRVRPWAQIIEGMSYQTRLKQGKHVMNTALKYEKLWSIPQTDTHPGFWFTGCRAVNFTRGVSSNLDRSPLQVRGSWEHCELWKYWWMTWQSKSYPYGVAYSDHVRECPSKWKEVYTPERSIGKPCLKLDQWLAGMNPTPQPRNWLNEKGDLDESQMDKCGSDGDVGVRSYEVCILVYSHVAGQTRKGVHQMVRLESWYWKFMHWSFVRTISSGLVGCRSDKWIDGQWLDL